MIQIYQSVSRDFSELNNIFFVMYIKSNFHKMVNAFINTLLFTVSSQKRV